MQGPAGVVSKGDFARIAGVSAARVSQYISQGQIGPEAMVGEGRAARINVAVAMRQLRDRLNIDQRLANGLGTRIDVPAGQGELPVSAAPSAAPAPPVVLPLRERTVEDQLKAEKLWRARSDRRKREREERAEAGLYTRTEDASREMKRMAADILEAIEGGLDGMARAISARFEVPTRDVLHVMRGEFRVVRERIAHGRRAAAAAMVETIEDPVAEDDETAGGADADVAELGDDDGDDED